MRVPVVKNGVTAGIEEAQHCHLTACQSPLKIGLYADCSSEKMVDLKGGEVDLLYQVTCLPCI